MVVFSITNCSKEVFFGTAVNARRLRIAARGFEHLHIGICLVIGVSHGLEVAVVLVEPQLRDWLVRFPADRTPRARKLWQITGEAPVSTAATAADPNERAGLRECRRLPRGGVNRLRIVEVTDALGVKGRPVVPAPSPSPSPSPRRESVSIAAN